MNTFTPENQITFTHMTCDPFEACSLRSFGDYMGVHTTAKNLCGVFKVTIQCDTQHEYNLLMKQVK